MLEIWKGATGNNKAFGALLTDLSTSFDCLSHDLLIAKLHAYGLDIDSLNILQDYLNNRKQGTKVYSFYSSFLGSNTLRGTSRLYRTTFVQYIYV